MWDAINLKSFAGSTGWFTSGTVAILCYLTVAIYQSEAEPNPPAAASQPQPAFSSSLATDQPLVQATLLCNVDAIKPGDSFTLAVLFDIAPGWHIYWKDPGDSGLPTEITLELPPGFQSGPIRYSRHQTFTMPGDIIGYGYERQAMLLTKVTAPAQLPVNRLMTLHAQADWLVCKEKCIPGQANLTLELPVSDHADKTNEQLFTYWHKQFLNTPTSNL